jgi:hypothetical protein
MMNADETHGGDAAREPEDQSGLYRPPDRYERDIPPDAPGPEGGPRVRGGDPEGGGRHPSPEPPFGADSADPAGTSEESQ